MSMQASGVDIGRVRDAMHTLDRANLREQLFQHYCTAIQTSFDIVQRELEHMLQLFNMKPPDEQPAVMAELLHRVGVRIANLQNPIVLLWPSSTSQLHFFRQTFLSSLYYALPPAFSPALAIYLRHILFKDTQDARWPLAEPTLITILDRFDPLLFGLIYEAIERKVEQECAGVFNSPKLRDLLNWLEGPVHKWVVGMYAKTMENGIEEAKKMLKPTFSRFDYHVHKTLALLRAEEIFQIIRAFPNSQPALEDLRLPHEPPRHRKLCLVKTDQRKTLIKRTREQMKQYKLHPGADTRDILTTYISMIQSLRILDPPGVMLSRTADPTRAYLRSREDTIRCIVSRLMEEESALAAELKAANAKPLHDAGHEAENYNDPKWTPDPVDAPADFRKSKGSDIIQMLVSIYDTKDVFIKELQVMLAQRLLAIKDYSLEKEMNNVEVFKSRFGEASLAGCEVMIKDLQDSKRIDTRVHERAQLGRAQQEYDRAFRSNRPDKKLRWLPQLGTVNVTVQLKDRELTLDVTPLQAAVLELFSTQETWTTDDLSIELMLMDTVSIRNALYFWNNQGVLKGLADDAWQLLEVRDKTDQAAPAHVIEEAQEAIQSVEAQQVEQMRVFWQYIKGMLTNLGALPVSRIHSTLNMLVPTFKGKTMDELVAFLEAMSAEGLVEKTPAGSWKIIK
ncbi:hypothetical protein OIV83_000121 [Microbotryomycetes sp. JL201]|nr:hypothetical protein OIV83_000121 [Microbotryomycetes sp. JL201]